MLENLDGKSALVAGAASGAGLAAARSLARAGCDVHLADADEAALEAAARSLGNDFAVDIEIHPTDLGETVNIEALALECDEVDIVISAQGALVAGTLNDFGGDEWRESWRQSFFSALVLSREMMESHIDRGHGLIAILMTGAMEPTVEDMGHCAANAALGAVIRALGGPAAEHGVHIAGFHAGAVDGFDDLGDRVRRLLSAPPPQEGGTIQTLDEPSGAT
jgi:NAD(P)-dependent dehydrogenase (short-subunit alcohol dehydrogenase family)